MDLLLIRHGTPVRVGEGEVEGPADPALSAEGRRQAELLAAWLAPERLDAVYSSPLIRALETAAPLAARRGLPVGIVDEIAEFDRDANHYIHFEELKATRDPRLAQMVAGDLSAYGEGDPAEFAARVDLGISGIIERHPGQRVAVFCHGGVINAWTSMVAGVARMLWFDAGYTGISRVQASRTGIRTILTLNEQPHLR